ncbi:MAG TPA: hypothetical protein VI461_14125 [Chitinophagaceae bacterium]|nr:hypothetical protein [Chitinophagaceae bacterium]
MKRIILCLALLISFYRITYSQGCNDAGFCTMGDMKPAQQIDSSKANIGISTIFRLGEKETMQLTFQPQADYYLWKSGKISVQAPVHFIYGNLGFVAGLGDIAPSFTQRLYSKRETKLSITLGGKIPVNNANLRKDDKPLPMAYQLGQGTWDGIVGVNLFYKLWHYSLGFQHNLNANGNQYIDSIYNNSSDIHYFDSQKIDRGDDILLRIERIFEKAGKSKYFLSILPIYRLQEATIENPKGERISVSSSSGLTLNINAGYLHSLGKNGKMKLLLGFPTITRHVRPDGLTGTFVVSFSANW